MRHLRGLEPAAGAAHGVHARHAPTTFSLYKANSATARITQATIPTPKAGVKLWMGKRNPVKLVSAVVKRKSAVVTGNLFEANIPPTTISPLPIATRVIMTCRPSTSLGSWKSPLLTHSLAERLRDIVANYSRGLQQAKWAATPLSRSANVAMGKSRHCELFDHLVSAVEQRRGTVKPSVLAILKLMINSRVAGRST